MRLNLPILEQLKDSQNILIAGAGGGFDVFNGIPIYFTLREMGKNVHFANYSFTRFEQAQKVSEPVVLIDSLLMGARGSLKQPLPYYPEGYLAQWLQQERGEDVTVWMFTGMGVKPLTMCYEELVKKFDIDAVILADGGVDSLMRGDEMGAGSLVEDSISLAAVDALDVPVKILGCLGFGTETEEAVCHYLALENMAEFTKAGGFLGSCALTPQMEVFQLFEAACRYVWEQPDHHKSHISTRIIPAVHGEFGDYHLYNHHPDVPLFVSLLMALYWFFDVKTVVEHSLIIDTLRDTLTADDAYIRAALKIKELSSDIRPRKNIPY